MESYDYAYLSILGEKLTKLWYTPSNSRVILTPMFIALDNVGLGDQSTVI